MVGISFVELLVIAISIIIFINPKEYPTLARGIGKYYLKLKNQFNQLLREINLLDIDQN